MKHSEKELLLARDRIAADIATFDEGTLEAAWAGAKQVALDARLNATITPSSENLRAAAEANARWAEAGEELERKADQVRHLRGALEAVQLELKQLRGADREERKRLAAAEIQTRLEASADVVEQAFADAATWLALGGTAPTEPVQVLAALEKVIGLRTHDVFRQARLRAAAALERALPPKPAANSDSKRASP